MSGGYLEPAQWYETLPMVYVSACMLLTDKQDQVLLVKPNYRPYWAIPGGIVEPGEPPDECAAREVSEELGLNLKPGELLVVDWVAAGDDRPHPMMNFTFDGGTIENPAGIRLQTHELDAAKFWPWAEAATNLPDVTAARIPAAHHARKNQRTVYLPAEHNHYRSAGSGETNPFRSGL